MSRLKSILNSNQRNTKHRTRLPSMFKEFHIKICVIILVHLHIAWSYRVYHLDADEENEVLSELKRALQGYQIPSYGEARPRQSRHRLKPVGKSMFVKRIIPHGYRTGEYEYDSRLNTVFKPLFRYHIAKPSDGQERSVERGIKPKKMSINDLISFLKKDRKTARLKQKRLKPLKKKLNMNKRGINKKRFGNISDMKHKEQLLREHFEKSGEKPDFGTANVTKDSHEAGKKITYPHYPFWNYWTYEKTVVQDQCPGNLVKIGNMCVSSIGHRRRWRRRRDRRRAVRPRQRKLRYG